MLDMEDNKDELWDSYKIDEMTEQELQEERDAVSHLLP